MSEFLIFGRPRSRTAWTANFLTHKNSLCFHEGLADSSGSVIRLKERLDALPHAHRGNADTGMIHELDSLLETFPDAKLVMLTENETSWRMFVERQQIPQSLVEKIDYDYRQAKHKLRHKALFVPVDLLTSNIVTALRVWKHCTTATFDFDRYDLLKDLNVQVKPESLRERLGI